MQGKSLEEARELSRTALDSPELVEIRRILNAAQARTAEVVSATADGYSALLWDPLREACDKAGIPAESRALERFLLLEAACQNIARIEGLPLYGEVKRLIYGELCFIAAPHRKWFSALDATTSGFQSMCRIVLLKRFPAGQLHWEVSGYPRSRLLAAPISDLPRVMWFVAVEMRGLKPYFVTHLATRWTVPFVMREDEDLKSCYRMARSMELQPEIRGYMSSTWLNDPEVPKTAPHLAWRLKKVEYGALLTTAGPAPVSSGFLEGSAERRQLYESGAWKPKMGVILWPRNRMLRWAHQYGERLKISNDTERRPGTHDSGSGTPESGSSGTGG